MTMVKRIFSVLLALMMLLGCAVAEEQELYLTQGDLPSRGIIMDLTKADVDMGLQIMTYVESELGNAPGLLFGYADPQAFAEAMVAIPAAFASGNIAEYERLGAEYSERNYTFYGLYLLPDAEIPDWIYKMYKEAAVIGENDGYIYVLCTWDYTVSEKDDPAVVEAARVRVDEMLKSIQYQPVVIPEEELADVPETVIPNAFPVFTTQDLNGNTVDNSLFAKADLTVLNIWGTTCYPCISEMPELQAWSDAMPENVQMVGLVLDVGIGDAEAIEMGQMICEATGVTYTNLILSEDLYEFAQGIIFTPTTIFVDRNGSVVGDPITGADVDGYKAFVESYFAK